MSKKKTPRVNSFLSSQEFRDSYQTWKAKELAENMPQLSQNMPEILAENSQELPEKLPEYGTASQLAENMADSMANNPPESHAKLADDELATQVTLEDLAEVIGEVADLREENAKLHEEMSIIIEHQKHGEETIEHLKQFTDYDENVQYYQAWNKFINKARGDEHEQ